MRNSNRLDTEFALDDASPAASRRWTSLVLPLALTALAIGAVTLFMRKVDADRDRILRDNRRVEEQAIREIKDILAESRSAAASYVAERQSAIDENNRRLQAEAKEVLSAIHRRLSSILERPRETRGNRRRDIAGFSQGFDGVRRLLEELPGDDTADWPVESLQAHAPELTSMLPSGYRLTVAENRIRPLIAVGGGTDAPGAERISASRELFFDDAGRYRSWIMQVEAAVIGEIRPPDAEDTANFLSGRFGALQLENGMEWGGCILGPNGSALAVFPQGGGTWGYGVAEGEWQATTNGRHFRVERMAASAPLAWAMAARISVPDPEPLPEAWEQATSDSKWGPALLALCLLSLASWIYAFRPAGRHSQTGQASPGAARAAPRLAARSEQENARQSMLAAQQPTRQPVPRGSLTRLQALHRGGANATGCKVLDNARSRILKDLAQRVRPKVPGRQPVAEPEAHMPQKTARPARISYTPVKA